MAKATLVKKIRHWIKENRKEALVLGLVLAVGAFFRLYRIAGYMTFLGDEGRDAIVVRRLLVDFDPILIGPRTSIGDMYLGPLYYYMMAPALLLSNFSPVGPSVMIALLGVVTIFFVWYIAREWFGKNAAFISGFLYAISPVVIAYSKSSWNPNIMPFFSLLSIYSIWQVWYKNNFKWLILTGVAIAFVLQSHYLGLLLFPTTVIFYVLVVYRYLRFRTLKKVRNLLKYSVSSLMIFVFLMSPLAIFDYRHGWRNFASMKKFFVERQTTVSLKPWKGLGTIWPIFRDNFITRIMGGNDPLIGKYAALVIFVGVVFLLIICFKKLIKLFSGNFKKDSDVNMFASGLALTVVWMFIGLSGMSLYKQHVYDHYFGFMFAAPFLLIGALSQKVFESLKDGWKIFLAAGILVVVVTNLMTNPLWNEPNYQMYRAKEVARLIQEKADGSSFNLAVIADRNYEDGYQYFLEKEGSKVLDIDAQIPETITEQLFVVCEKPKEECDPTHNPKTEVANFGWSDVEGEWETEGVVVFKLVHSN